MNASSSQNRTLPRRFPKDLNLWFGLLFCAFFWTGRLGAIENIPLKINPASAHEAEIIALEQGAFSVLTTGTDPFITTHLLPEGALPDEAMVFSFEYFSPEGLDHWEVFWGPPMRAGDSAKGGPLPPAELWRPASLNLRTLSAGRWNGQARQLRLDFGSKPGVRLQLRNLHLRGLHAEEIEQDRKTQAARERKARDAAAIRLYLKKEFPARIESVHCKGASLFIEGQVSGGTEGALYLAELQMHEEPWREGPRTYTIPVQSTPNGTFHAMVERYLDGRDRLFSRWQLVQEENGAEIPVSHARHATEPVLPFPNIPLKKQERRTKKGMGGVTLNPIAGELEEMGVEHVTINIVLNRFFRPVERLDTLSYAFEGRSYPLDKRAVEDLDKTLSFFSKFANVSAILLVALSKNQDEPNPLSHPESGPPGIFAMPNLSSSEGVQTYRAALAFLAERYAHGAHGRITHWILHNEIDQAFTWTNMGEQPMDIIMDHYVRSMRLASLSARQFNPEAKVFISLTHHWTAPGGDSLQHYRPKEMLDRLAEYSRLEGDFEWGVAYHPYPQNLFEPATWKDRGPVPQFDTPYITLKNIEVLDAYLRRPPLLYGGKTPRTVLLSEQGFHTRDASEATQRIQAAALVYAWHKIRPLTTIEAFHHHRWIDAQDEGGLLLGLRTLPTPEKPFGERKSAWHLYRALDTPEEAMASTFARDILGVSDFHEIPFREKITEQRENP